MRETGKHDPTSIIARPLRVLIVEDQPADAELVIAVLKRAGHSLSFEIVDTPEQFKERIEHAKFDLTLSDHNLRNWTGMDVLECLHKSGKEIPFIVVTGTLGDEAAVEYIKQGAADYVLKHRLERLPVVVGRALRKKAHREETARLQEEVFSAKKEWELTFDQVPDAVFLLDEDGRVRRANRAAAAVLGLDFKQIIGQPCYEMIHGLGEPRPGRPPLQEVLDMGEGVRKDIEGPRLGKVFEVASSPLRDSAGGLCGAVVVMRDVTERKRAEEALVKLRKAVDTSGEVVFMTDREGVITFVNPEFTRLYGYTAEEVVGRTTPRVLKSGHTSQEDYASFWKAILDMRVVKGEWVDRTKVGRLVDVEYSANPILDEQGNITGFLAIQGDITERKRAAENLSASEVRYRRLFEAAKDGILILDAGTGEIIDVNPFLVNLLGYSRQEFLGKRLWEIGPFKDKRNSQESFLVLQENEYIRYDDLPLETISGKRVDVEFVSNAYWAGEKKVIQCNIRDVTERKQEAEKLRQSEVLFRLISENVTDLIAVVDLDGRRVYNSPSYGGVIGNPDALRGTVSFNEIHPEDRENIKAVFRETIRTGIGQRAEYRFLLEDKTTRLIESQGSLIRNQQGEPVSVLIVSRDITQRKSMEEQLRQAQKMEAIGQLAGGVAHDFNNLLTIISGFAELVSSGLGPENPHQGHVKEIQKAADRAAGLTRQLLAFGRRQVLSPQVLDLNNVVTNVDKMLRRLIGEDIELVTIPGQELGRVKADAGQVEQIIMNLAVNSRDAMPKGGKLTIETADVILDESYARGHISVTPGAYVMLAVSDNGCGMDANTRARVFEPFFTTKEMGKGTGLGLATVYGIVKQSGGHIWLYSEPGKGSTFKVYLPRVDGAVTGLSSVQTGSDERRGAETVLVVEDEDTIRTLVRSILESKGYTILDAASGAEALSICELHPETIHLILTDVVMAHMSGPELAQQLALRRPETKVLYMSGYTNNAICHHGLLDRNLAFIEKPFTPQALVAKVREVLDSPSVQQAEAA